MKIILSVLLLVNLTACAAYGDFVDRQDPCQRKGKAEGYVKPGWCGGSTTYFVQRGIGPGQYVITRSN